ncbi:MAG TPA: holo-ACP synthase [Chloroflexota bacterium]|nr:holo-ACP synthase [Chloroflexota bacterium]
MPGKAYWLRILPPAAQQEQFLRGAGTLRDVYSWALAWRKAYDHAHGTSPRHVATPCRRVEQSKGAQRKELRLMLPLEGAWAGDDAGGPHAGVDAAEIPRIHRALERWGQRFLDRVYTPGEQAYCRGRAERLAGRFAAKEAVSKALGTGIRRLRWRDIEILPNRRGRPTMYLHGKAAARARAMGATWLSVSITHTDTLAIAFVIAR